MIPAYLIGPYRAASVWGIQENINKARRIALKYWKQGYAVVCPHANTALMDGACPDDVWLEGDIEIMRCLPIVIVMQGWEASSGSRGEVAIARSSGKRIIYDDGKEE